MDKKLLEKVCALTVLPLMEFLKEELVKYYDEVLMVKDESHGYLYAKGTLPVAVIAHLDTVHKKPVATIKVSKANHMSSPEGIGGDDRCGVYIILGLLLTKFRPTIIFTTGEEVGGFGARSFTQAYKELENVNWMIEFDRAGYNDVVKYDDRNEGLYDEIAKFGFEKKYGTFTDISILAPHFGISAVNLSAAYYKPHQTAEYIDLYELEVIFHKVMRILSSQLVKKAFKYEGKKNVSSYAESKRLESFSSPNKSLWDFGRQNETAYTKYKSEGSYNRHIDSLMGECVYCHAKGLVHDSPDGYMCQKCLDKYVDANPNTIACQTCGHVHEITEENRKNHFRICEYCAETIWLNDDKESGN